MRTPHYITIIASALLCLLLLVGCDVHELPSASPTAPLCLNLRFSTDMTMTEHPIDASRTDVQPSAALTSGKMRYIIRLYDQNAKSKSKSKSKASDADIVGEYIFTRNIADGYDAQFLIDVAPGTYSVMVWADISDEAGKAPRFYNADLFSAIAILPDHEGSTDYRDAFRGSTDITVTTDIFEQSPSTVEIAMERPMAKFEFVTTDIEEFIEREINAALSRGEINLNDITPENSLIDTEQYDVVFYYTGFMPSTYNLFTDKPIDSTIGTTFHGRITRLNNSEASIGFDYVFVNGSETYVTIQIAIFDRNGRQLSLSNPTKVPLRRNNHTVMKGRFLMQSAHGGVSVDPSFGGNFNISI